MDHDFEDLEQTGGGDGGRGSAFAKDLILDPDASDYHSRKFSAYLYRTTRAIVAQRGLIMPGQALSEPGVDALEATGPIMSSTTPFHQSSAPALPHNTITEEGLAEMMKFHSFLAIKLGLEPEDPCLNLFDEPRFYPSPERMLDWESRLLEVLGMELLTKGRLSAFRLAQSLLGPIGILERRDFLSLPYAWVRDVQTADSEEDRALMVLRLEELATRAEEALDVRATAAILRQIAQVKGLTFQDEDRQNRELMIAFRTAERKPKITAEKPKELSE